MPPDPASSPLLTDLYQLNMLQAYLDHGETHEAVFEFFVRRLPPRRGFLMAAGLEQALDFLETVRFSPEELEWLSATGRFSARLIDWLADFRFTGEVEAMAEGTVFFPDEPILRVVAPLPAASEKAMENKGKRRGMHAVPETAVEPAIDQNGVRRGKLSHRDGWNRVAMRGDAATA